MHGREFRWAFGTRVVGKSRASSLGNPDRARLVGTGVNDWHRALVDRVRPPADLALLTMPKTRISPNQTDPTVISRPVAKLVHPNLKKAWKIHSGHSMCYIFDAVIPVRQWKRGTISTDDDPWAEYGDEPWDDLTESNERGELQPYYPRSLSELSPSLPLSRQR